MTPLLIWRGGRKRIGEWLMMMMMMMMIVMMIRGEDGCDDGCHNDDRG